ncbi:MAG: BofC C-terminal domain-containing protein [Oscillospiraceae bacterium]|nr:BofC C-terminal domain-containing protein [Oscillospiraceae bacterium]MDD3261879.1 BofC C-terminal domain-containing protein [Oscillospiraceae bacterium]
MKKLNTALLMCAVALAAVLVVSLSVAVVGRETEKTPSSTSVYSSSNPLSSQGSTAGQASLGSAASGVQKQALYLVKTYNGKIGIFRVGETKPFRVLEVETASLPPADQELLRSGISVQSTQELQSVIEDYVS